jgi:hypothetical protein
MTDEQEHARVRTVLDDVAGANTKRTMERIAAMSPAEKAMFDELTKPEGGSIRIRLDTDPRIENGGKPLRIRGMIEDGKLVLPGEEPSDG